ncbi:MAG: amphi-Trp domain-containing protein [Actinomycetota bacterium]|nr:amphi-Trp domain-containing protein [Actinomycetota bacterium]
MDDATRDVERGYPVNEFVAKLRRLADALESGKPFRIQVAGERVNVPRHARITVEHEREDGEEEVEFQLKWSSAESEEDEEDEDDQPVV